MAPTIASFLPTTRSAAPSTYALAWAALYSASPAACSSLPDSTHVVAPVTFPTASTRVPFTEWYWPVTLLTGKIKTFQTPLLDCKVGRDVPRFGSIWGGGGSGRRHCHDNIVELLKNWFVWGIALCQLPSVLYILGSKNCERERLNGSYDITMTLWRASTASLAPQHLRSVTTCIMNRCHRCRQYPLILERISLRHTLISYINLKDPHHSSQSQNQVTLFHNDFLIN